jgi:hypothetical protein
VQVIGTIAAMQSVRHDKDYAISSIATHPCKKRKDGAPTFHYGKRKAAARIEAWATRLSFDPKREQPASFTACGLRGGLFGID